MDIASTMACSAICWVMTVLHTAVLATAGAQESHGGTSLIIMIRIMTVIMIMIVINIVIMIMTFLMVTSTVRLLARLGREAGRSGAVLLYWTVSSSLESSDICWERLKLSMSC